MNVSDRLRVHAGSVLTTTDRVLVEAADEIDRLRAENQALREALECIAGGEIYPREVAREALAAKGE